MTISEKIFRILSEQNISQKEFSEKTGIPQSTISDWKKKKTNPASDKILIICETLQVEPQILLSCVSEEGVRSRGLGCRVIANNTPEGILLEKYEKLDERMKERLRGYIEALQE